MTRTLTACFAAAALLAAGTASAALKPESLRLALDSLLVATTKQSVANAILNNPKPPERNRDVNMGPPYTLTTEEIQAVFVGHGGMITIKFTGAIGMDNAFVRFLPKVVKGADGKPTVQYACVSPNIAEIASVYPGCTYDPNAMKLQEKKPAAGK